MARKKAGGEESVADFASPAEAPYTEELALADSDERLPWLESGDYDDESTGVDTGRLVGFALLAAIALAVIIGAIWYVGSRGPDPALVADGSTIPAPEGPYKVKPADPGGKTFAGTGNLAPAVGEGLETEGRLAEETVPTPTAAPSATARASATPASTGGVGVQVGAYTSRAMAEAGWTKLTTRTEALTGVGHRVVEGEADMGTVFRLQAVAGDVAGANRLCNALKSNGIDCQVKN
jgi:hypothetical protein